MIGQPAWVAMSDNALALGVGAGEDAKLADTLKEPGGDAGRMTRMHLDGAMYLSWLKLMEQKADSLAAMSAAMAKSDDARDDAADRCGQGARPRRGHAYPGAARRHEGTGRADQGDRARRCTSTPMAW